MRRYWLHWTDSLCLTLHMQSHQSILFSVSVTYVFLVHLYIILHPGKRSNGTSCFDLLHHKQYWLTEHLLSAIHWGTLVKLWSSNDFRTGAGPGERVRDNPKPPFGPLLKAPSAQLQPHNARSPSQAQIPAAAKEFRLISMTPRSPGLLSRQERGSVPITIASDETLCFELGGHAPPRYPARLS